MSRQYYPPLTAVESARRVELYREGYSFAEIGKMCDVTDEAIRLHLRSIGEHQPRRDWRYVSPAKRDRAVLLYEAGYTIAQIERVVDVSRTMLYNECDRRGIPRRSPTGSEGARRAWVTRRERAQ